MTVSQKVTPSLHWERLGRNSATDGGDTACQGSVNVDQIGLLATPELVPVRLLIGSALNRTRALNRTGY